MKGGGWFALAAVGVAALYAAWRLGEGRPRGRADRAVRRHAEPAPARAKAPLEALEHTLARIEELRRSRRR